MNITQKALEELEALQKDGLLYAADIVKAARRTRSALHDYFEWDDSKAAQEYRLEQARHIVRAVVTIIPQHNEPIRAFVSLRKDRQQAKGGYRSMSTVLSDKDLRKVLLKDALSDFEKAELKYSQLTELNKVWRAVRQVRKELED